MGPIIKEREHAPEGFFEAEAAGLAWLAAAGGARVARVLDSAPGRIVLERIVHATPSAAAARDFGRALARTHGAGAPEFGARPEGWNGPLFIGNRAMPTTTAASWGSFYANARVMPFLAPAIAAGHLRGEEARIVSRACEAVAAGAFDDDAPPSRIHGDLWAGNVLFSPTGVVLIDPAAHGGHAETDLAMLALFGLPFLDDALAGYQEVSPLVDGWRERRAVHQLHPLAVHAAGHGRGYGVALVDASRAVLELA